MGVGHGSAGLTMTGMGRGSAGLTMTWGRA